MTGHVSSAFPGAQDHRTHSSTVNKSPSESMSFITEVICKFIFTDVHMRNNYRPNRALVTFPLVREFGLQTPRLRVLWWRPIQNLVHTWRKALKAPSEGTLNHVLKISQKREIKQKRGRTSRHLQQPKQAKLPWYTKPCK